MLTKDLIEKLDKSAFLAGGLNLNNIKEAIQKANHYGVDVNSGCKNEHGKKDRQKVNKY